MNSSLTGALDANGEFVTWMVVYVFTDRVGMVELQGTQKTISLWPDQPMNMFVFRFRGDL